jgi:hypothetical protein
MTKIDTVAIPVPADSPEMTGLVNEPCPLCGSLVQAARAEKPELVAMEPCGCRV